ncbi:MAG TPA: toxin-antitoxin system HicB family antitoxin [Kofleriaceae bacterium]|jgi:predicted HicB family RNase H-like nuclease
MAKALYHSDKYTYRVIWSEADQEHVGLCAEFPSLSHLAPSVNAALAGIMDLVRDVIDDMVKAKEEPPAPLSLQQFKGSIALRVPPERHRELVMEAAEAGISLNRLISDKLAR